MNNRTRGGTNEPKELIIKLVIAVLIIGGALGASYLIARVGLFADAAFELVLTLSALAIFAVIFGSALTILLIRRKRGAAAIESMNDFFAARVEGYEEHMLKEVVGCAEAYGIIEELLPDATASVLDLGCGTGLELSGVFKRFPNAEILCIDLCTAMTDKLKEHYPCQNVRIITADFRDARLPSERFDCAISVEAMHHLSRDEKVRLYAEICKSLKENGRFVLCDYFAKDEADAKAAKEEYDRLRRTHGLKEGEAYHIDLPFTVDEEISILRDAGFFTVQQRLHLGNTSVITTDKQRI